MGTVDINIRLSIFWPVIPLGSDTLLTSSIKKSIGNTVTTSLSISNKTTDPITSLYFSAVTFFPRIPFKSSDLIPPGEAQILNYIYDGYAYINITGKGKVEGIICVNPLNFNVLLIKLPSLLFISLCVAIYSSSLNEVSFFSGPHLTK